jgi:DNA-binding Lrp family transcriptional regulator
MTTRKNLECRLVDEFQSGFPLVSRPFAALAARLACSEAAVIEILRALHDEGAVSRVGAVIAPHTAGWSTLAAMSVPPVRLEAVAALVSAHPEVNHNYEREHRLNLWFVVTAADREAVNHVLHDIGDRTGLFVVDLPLEKAFRIDLGFPLRWN